ncbi:SusC/RagA family TonB-linked outer membrane protein [Pedobacter sp. GR22-6]|uniref:SusC/RagA family TonB-linked outer membrane protein n=1 Tax=Pedobacter sp. GR22-6 TaxID=3127957 RepID=UPI00307E1A5C
MKLTAFLIFISLLQVNAESFSQISLNARKVPLVNVLRQIRAQTGYTFFYEDKDVSERMVNIQVSNVSLDQALSICLKGTSLDFELVEDNVVIKPREKSLLNALSEMVSLPRTVNGTVSDAKGPIPNVNVRVKGTSRSTVTDAQGRFRLERLEKGDILVLTCIGYKTQEVIIKDSDLLAVHMDVNITDLDQVVVMAYGSIRKKDLTGSVSVIDIKDVQDVPFNTIDNALAGKASGVQITKTDGTPGGAVRMRIRGSTSLLGGNEPLYVIDGVPVQVGSAYQEPGYGISSPMGNAVNNPLLGNGGSTSALSTAFVNGLNTLGGLNVDDIESITILKDASSTALYGSKAANGVVVITTKKGKSDQPAQFSASYSSTLQTALKPDLLNGPEFVELFTESVRNASNRYKSFNIIPGAFITNLLANPASFFGTANTDWIDEVTRQPIAHNAELSMQGGGSSSRYFTSLSYNQTPGVVRATDLNRISGKLNIESDIRNRLKLVANMLLGYTDQNIGDGAYAQALRARPDLAPYSASGTLTDFTAPGSVRRSPFMNPLALLTATNNAKKFSLLGSFSGIYDITRDLQFKSIVSLNMYSYNQRLYTPSYLTVGGLGSATYSNDGIGNNSNSRFADWLLENTLNYRKEINENHSLDLLIGTSYETTKMSMFSVTATGYPNDNVLNNLSSAIRPIFTKGDDPGRPQAYLVSFFARANYGYLDKYLFTFTGRADGSSKFGAENKFGYFPSAAIAWRVSKENFLKNVSWISDIKFRGSYGVTGNQNIGDQMSRTLYSPYSYAGQSALIPNQLGNETLKWESTRSTDGGMDISLFKERLSVVVDYYRKQTNGALISLPLAPSSSYGSILSNVVGIRNTGWEAALSGDILRTRFFRWNGSFNITFNESMVTKLSADASLSQIGDLTGLNMGNTALIEGRPLGLITGKNVKGLIRTAEDLAAYKKKMGIYANRQPYAYMGIGDPIYELNNENATNGSLPNYNVIIGSAAPKYFGGFTQGFSYKNLDLQLYFTYSQGGSLIWGDHASSMQFSNNTNMNASILERYTPENPNTDHPLLWYGSQYDKSNLDVFSSSFIKLRTLSLNYRFVPNLWMSKAGIRQLGIFATAMNVFTVTRYPGLDPEVSNDPYSVTGGYIDASNYPSVRSFTIGFKTTF